VECLSPLVEFELREGHDAIKKEAWPLQGGVSASRARGIRTPTHTQSGGKGRDIQPLRLQFQNRHRFYQFDRSGSVRARPSAGSASVSSAFAICAAAHETHVQNVQNSKAWICWVSHTVRR
jgi:hypothetical protein